MNMNQYVTGAVIINANIQMYKNSQIKMLS